LTNRQIDSPTGWAEISVGDTGEGIPADQLDAIFDKFYQVWHNNHRKTPGTGLGLAIAKSLVELQGGRIWAESEVARGSRFAFTLAVVEAPPTANSESSSDG
jgi:signal transduction histidine kinase